MPASFDIFPAIGVARVGTSQEFFIGPEPDVPLNVKRRDANGELLRQAARFRIYDCNRDANGKLLSASEVATADTLIEWSVRLVNRKAAAERFNGGQGGGGRRNNATGNDTADQALIIDSGIQTISTLGQIKALNGQFRGNAVSLGRLEMQNDGRLCVIGGEGRSESVPSNQAIRDFADNDDWHDDVGDGSVTARITRGGQTFETTPAWVIVAPPDFAPEIQNVINMYDVLFDLAVARGVLSAPPVIFFDQHIRPILERAISMQWVNRQARLGYDDTTSGGHSTGGPGDFDLTALGMVGSPNPPRQRIFRLLRDPATGTFPPPPVNRRKHMPRLNDDNDSGEVLPLTPQQYRAMQLWSQGQFQISDPAAVPELLPDALTRVALQACAGGAFFPGIEAGRIMRDPTRYVAHEAFRLSHAGVAPGEITARNAVPWQADFHLCRWESDSSPGNPKLLGWWPAQRPDDVLKAAGGNPVPWARGLADTAESMVANWHRLGFVKQDLANPGVFIEQDRDPALQESGTV
jgi:L-lysine epsilon oxidase-like protein